MFKYHTYFHVENQSCKMAKNFGPDPTLIDSCTQKDETRIECLTKWRISRCVEMLGRFGIKFLKN